jgi:Protein of unknown function (DUF4199)
MKKIVLTFGLIAGFLIAGFVWGTAILVERDSIGFERLEVVGYASMIIALSMVFFGIKSYRDNYAGGTLRFWKGVQVGVLISLIAGVMYWGGAMSYGITHPGFDKRFMAKFTEIKIGKMQSSGASQDQIDSAKKEVEIMQTLFENPVLFFLVCLMEILPVGFIVTLVSAGLLRRNELLPAQPA